MKVLAGILTVMEAGYTMASSSNAKTEKDSKACDAADQFQKVYYVNFDQKRQDIKAMYSREACLVWNGTPVKGQEEIGTFLGKLPRSEHTMQSLDAQVLPRTYTEGQETVAVQVVGSVLYERRLHTFFQSFLLTVEEDKWRIIMDRFRFMN